jgi:hypothetical protein
VDVVPPSDAQIGGIKALIVSTWIGAPFPLSLDPPTAHVTISIDFVSVEQSPGLRFRIEDVDVDVNILARVLGFFLLPPFPGFSELLLTFFPSASIQALGSSLPTVRLDPIAVLIPGTCEKKWLSFGSLRLGILPSAFTNGVGIQIEVSDRVPRQPTVSIRSLRGNRFNVKISGINNVRIPVLSGQFMIDSPGDLRGAPKS